MGLGTNKISVYTIFYLPRGDCNCSTLVAQMLRLQGTLNSKTTAARRMYLEGHGDLVTGLIMGITGVIIWRIGAVSILTKSQ